jgi:putative transposase
MRSESDHPKGYRYPKLIISHAVWLYHHFTLSYRDVQELLFERGIEVTYESIRRWCSRFGAEFAERIKRRRRPRGRTWHLDEVHVVIAGQVHWLWRAIDEHGEVLDILLQEDRDTGAANRFFKRLLDEHYIPEQVVTDGLRSYSAAIKEVPELSCSEHTTVSAAEHQNNLIEQSHRPTRNQERQQQGFRDRRRAQRFLLAHAHISNLFNKTRTQVPANERRFNLRVALDTWGEVALEMT